MQVTEAIAERRHLEDELARCKQTLEAAQEVNANVLSEAHAHLSNQRSTEARRHVTAHPGVARSAPEPPSSPRPTQRVHTDRQPFPSKARSEVQADTSIAFPRTNSPSTTPDYQFSYNPLPRPPEPVPLARLPAFARPRPGSRAYEAARTLARHKTGHGRQKDSDKEKDKDKDKGKERAKSKERERSKGKSRERQKPKARDDDTSTTKDSVRKGDKEVDKTTDTSATETQERQRSRGRKSSIGRSSSQVDRSRKAKATEDHDLTLANETFNSIQLPSRSIVGGWGLEKNWRSSITSSGSGASGSQESLVQALFDPPEGAGSSHTRVKEVDIGKGKSKDISSERDSAVDQTREAKEVASKFPSSSQQNLEITNPRNSMYQQNPSPFPSDPVPPTRDRRNTLSAAPSALGLVLVPSPDGQGGYKYEYQYRYIPTQPSSQSNGKNSVTPVASYSTYPVTQYPNYQVYPSQPLVDDHAASFRTAALSRRVTDSHLTSHAQASQQQAPGNAAPSLVTPIPRAPGVPSSNALYVPQPRRVSLTIPDPEAGPSPQHRSEVQAPRPHGQRDSFHVQASHYDGSQGPSQPSLYRNENPSANMSLDSALASLSLAPSQYNQTLKHKSSDASTSSASTGISLTGTSSEKRKQLLDALFAENSVHRARPVDTSDSHHLQEGVRNRTERTPRMTLPVSGNAPSLYRAEGAIRGVPSRDGRPSRGLSGGTRPSTAHASSSHAPTMNTSHQGQLVDDGSSAVKDVYAAYTAYRQQMHVLPRLYA